MGALTEGILTEDTDIDCTGTFDKIAPPPSCWNRSGHGSLNVTGGIRHSCNPFFFETAYRLGLTGESYSSDKGLSMLEKYADMYGLTDTSGIEIEETMPQVSTEDAVRSSIGQGNHSFSTVGLARYVTTVANSGTCYNLTLVDKITDHSGIVLEDNSAQVRNTIDMQDAYWDAIHSGMRQLMENNSYYRELGVSVAGKTGTAEENKRRANHALFVCYAPCEEPEIAIATRIAFGYSSSYAAQTTRDIIEYYFDLRDENELITGTASQITASTSVTD